MGKKLGSFLLVLLFAACIAVLLDMMPGLLSRMDSYQLAFWTAVFIFLPLNVVYLFIKAFGIRQNNTGSILISIAASAFLYGGFVLMAISVAKLGFNSSLALVLLAPILFIAVVPVITKESVNAAQVIGILLTAAGAFCILYSLGLIHPGSWAEVGYVIGAAVCWAVFSLLALRTKTGIFANVYLYLLTGLIIATVLMFLQSSFILPTYGTVGLLLIFGVILATALYLWAGTFRIASASFWSAMMFMLPAVLLIYGFLFNSVSIPFIGIIGLGITGIAVIYRLVIRM